MEAALAKADGELGLAGPVPGAGHLCLAAEPRPPSARIVSFRVTTPSGEDLDLGPTLEVLRAFGHFGRLEPEEEFGHRTASRRWMESGSTAVRSRRRAARRGGPSSATATCSTASSALLLRAIAEAPE